MALKYNCDACEYSSDRLDNYKRHLASNGHEIKQRQYTALGHPVSSTPPKDSGIVLSDDTYFCSCCEKVLKKHHQAKHFKTCKLLKSKMEMQDARQIMELKNDLMWSKKEYEFRLLLKDKDYKLLEKDKENESLKHQLEVKQLKDDLNAKTQIINSNNTNNSHNTKKKNSDNKSVSFIYIKNNYKDAPVYADIMAKPLTAEERESIRGDDPATACAKLITSRCLTNVDMDKRPFHCLDMARNKFAVRINNNWGVPKWTIDLGGEHILSCGFEKIREEFPIRKVDENTKLRNNISLQKMMLPINRKRILRELCRLGHVNTIGVENF